MPELRALDLMKSVPNGCIAFPVTDENTEPHLHAGEFAVVDTNDREPIVGELYVVEQNSPLAPRGKCRRIIQVCRFGDATLENGSPALFVGSYARDQHIPGYGRTRMLDGAFSTDGLSRQLVGRVIGVLG